MVLPVAVARQVPLRIGSRTLTRGTVGSQDDRVALQLTTIA
jgi:flagellar motor switch protein FliM